MRLDTFVVGPIRGGRLGAHRHVHEDAIRRVELLGLRLLASEVEDLELLPQPLRLADAPYSLLPRQLKVNCSNWVGLDSLTT